MLGVKASEVDARSSVQALGAAFELYRRGFAPAIDSRRDHQRQPDRLLRQSRIVHHDIERPAFDARCALRNVGGQRQYAVDRQAALAGTRLPDDLDRIRLESRCIASDVRNGEREVKRTDTAPLHGELDAFARGLLRRYGEPRSGQPHFECTAFGLDIQRSLELTDIHCVRGRHQLFRPHVELHRALSEASVRLERQVVDSGEPAVLGPCKLHIDRDFRRQRRIVDADVGRCLKGMRTPGA